MFILSGRDVHSFRRPFQGHHIISNACDNRRTVETIRNVIVPSAIRTLLSVSSSLRSSVAHFSFGALRDNPKYFSADCEGKAFTNSFCFRSFRPVAMDVPHIPTSSTSHDCGSLSRVVMVRKTDQRMINHKKPKAVSYSHCSFAQLFIGIYCLESKTIFRIPNVSSSLSKPSRRTGDTSPTEPS